MNAVHTYETREVRGYGHAPTHILAVSDFTYPSEPLDAAERNLLAPHVSNLYGPVFALTNLPETVKGALFARYSRYQGTLRRLFIDEFADSLPSVTSVEEGEGARAAKLYESVFAGFGDDSIADLGGVHVGAEWCSNLLTKILQRPRIGAYLEQSTRYIAFDQPIDEAGRYRYYRQADFGPGYELTMDGLFESYSRLLPLMREWAGERFPRGADEPEGPWRRAINAKALDSLRGLLPAASLSHMGIYASGRTYEQLVMHLLAHPLPEAQRYGSMLLTELNKVIPSFMARIERPERGGVWIDFLTQRRAAATELAQRFETTAEDQPLEHGPSVTLLSADGDERQLLAALLIEQSTVSERRLARRIEALSELEVAEQLLALTGSRPDRRHKPGRGLERLRYRFEIVADYGTFRDLQRHRLLTAQWQTLTPDLGAEIPPEISDAGPRISDQFRATLHASRAEYERLRAGHGPELAAYALCLAYRIRFTFDLNAREAMHLIELRSGAAGHPAYRAVALEMGRKISEVHPSVGAMLTHTDHSTDAHLERITSEIRSEAKLTR
jgi:thymidylate synthase ThyX